MCRCAAPASAARWLSMISAEQLDALDPQMRQAMLTLLAELRAKDELIAQRDREAAFKQALAETFK